MKIYEKLDKILDFIRENQQTIDELTLKNELFEQELVNIIQNSLVVPSFDWGNINRYKKLDRDAYEEYCDFLKNNILDLDKKCYLIDKYNFISKAATVLFNTAIIGYNIYFLVNDEVFILFYPEVKNINQENYILAHEGKFVLYHHKTIAINEYERLISSDECLISSYRAIDIQNKLKEFLDNV